MAAAPYPCTCAAWLGAGAGASLPLPLVLARRRPRPRARPRGLFSRWRAAGWRAAADSTAPLVLAADDCDVEPVPEPVKRSRKARRHARLHHERSRADRALRRLLRGAQHSGPRTTPHALDGRPRPRLACRPRRSGQLPAVPWRSSGGAALLSTRTRVTAPAVLPRATHTPRTHISHPLPRLPPWPPLRLSCHLLQHGR